MTSRNDLARTIRDWRRYRRTVAEIEAMPFDVSLDLGIFREDARQIARRVVYGQ